MNYQVDEVRPIVSIKKLILTESREYKDMWLRPYEVNVDYADLNKVQSVIEHSLQTNTRNAIPAYISKTTPNIITPSSTVIGASSIVNGWGEKRFKFVLILEVTYPGRAYAIINYVQGYTSYLGISQSGHIDPNMTFHPNMVIKLRKTIDPTTGMISTEPIGEFNVVFDETRQNLNTFNAFKLARPSDIALKATSLKSTEDATFISNIGSINDMQIVNKNEILPIDHLGATVKAAVESSMLSGAYSDSSDTLDTMVGSLTEPALYQLEFFKLLYNIKGADTKTFTIQDLALVDNNVQNITNVFLTDGVSNYGLQLPPQLLTEDTATTYDASIETRLSVVVHEAVASLLSESLLNVVSFTIDNMSGQPEYAILDIDSYIEGLNRPVYGEMFMAKFMNKVWASISNNNNHLVRILVHGMLESDTTISISIDNGPEMVYRYPTFADSKFLPVILDNPRLDIMAENYMGIVDVAMETTNNVVRNASNLNPNMGSNIII